MVFVSPLSLSLIRMLCLTVMSPLRKVEAKDEVAWLQERPNLGDATVLQLATHTSGLPRDAANNLGDGYTDEQLYSFLSGHTLIRKPGAKHDYSNLGVGLLGHVIALKAGTDFESLLQARICSPLKMESTGIRLTPALKAR